MTEPVHCQVLTRRAWLKSALPLLLASGTLARAAESPVLRVGFIANYEPFSFLKNDGRLAGFDVDTVEALLASVGMQMQAVTARYGRLRELAKAGQIDMVGNQLLMLAENRSLFEFVRPYALNSLVCVQHEDDERDFLSLDDFVGRRLPKKQGLAVVRGNSDLSKKLSESIPTLTRSQEFRQISSRWFGYDVSKPRVSHVVADEV